MRVTSLIYDLTLWQIYCRLWKWNSRDSWYRWISDDDVSKSWWHTFWLSV